MEELLDRLCRSAAKEGACAQATLEDGMRMLVYPLEEGRHGGQLVVLGWPGATGRAPHGDALLRRRGADIARYGAWLPALFNDGGWYLVCRTASSGTPDGAALEAALELLQ